MKKFTIKRQLINGTFIAISSGLLLSAPSAHAYDPYKAQRVIDLIQQSWETAAKSIPTPPPTPRPTYIPAPYESLYSMSITCINFNKDSAIIKQNYSKEPREILAEGVEIHRKRIAEMEAQIKSKGHCYGIE